VEFLMDVAIRLTTPREEAEIRELAESRVAWIDDEELATLGFFELREAWAAGIAAHHAGMLPVFKEIVETLFQRGLVKVVFATETLSLGINMPAKTVVIEDLWKFSGERHELLTPGEYTQLTGRAGRRGIDEIGYAAVLFQKQVPFERVAGLASTHRSGSSWPTVAWSCWNGSSNGTGPSCPGTWSRCDATGATSWSTGGSESGPTGSGARPGPGGPGIRRPPPEPRWEPSARGTSSRCRRPGDGAWPWSPATGRAGRPC
jgi:RNA-binding protein YhbY